ncbi:hypothetical protein [Sulfuricurvum sp.]|uniref:hypothetical protein n=1 Tax=Sulfuricurvum sp. TaxID=2025608 RepID=UPI0026047246|nr:hypothetical protein [Sulfuricurvum sp.]MDD2265836.1 hypothetical protein [Sulfuricurvum sp.]MDD2784518.1 hypothetical protein [Sulfuricurvum sp.]
MFQKIKNYCIVLLFAMLQHFYSFKMKKSLTFIMLLFVVVMISGCGETWQGAKNDTIDNAQWSKDTVNDGAKNLEKKKLIDPRESR